MPFAPTAHRLRRALLLGCSLLLLGPAAAHADTASVSFTDAAGNSDPAVGVGRTFTLAGNASTEKRVYIRYRASGGAPCAPSASSDSGSPGLNDFQGSGDQFNGTRVNGNFSLKKTGTWQKAGTFMFCIWLAGADDESVTPITQLVTFRAPTGTISGTLSPANPKVGESAALGVTGSSEASRRVYATMRTGGGAPCATSASADTGRRIIDGESVNGAFALQRSVSTSEPGTYLICLWLASSSDDGAPVAGPQPVTFNVLAPPPPCVVPSLATGSSLQSALDALGAANCTLGARRYTTSRTHPRGSFIKFTAAVGTSLGHMAPVGILLSSGKPCRVPSRLSRERLSSAKARIRAAGCTVGKVRYVRTRARSRGIVVAFSPRPGTRLEPHAAVGITVTRGR